MEGLQGVPETLLITLWARGVESRRQDPLFRDPKAEEILSSLEAAYDFSIFQKAWRSQLGVSVRTMLLDRGVRDFLLRHPRGTLVNLGAGLDTRFYRMNQKNIAHWYDLDLPEVISIREKFLPASEQNPHIKASLFDYSWMEDIVFSEKQPVLFIAEGILMYFPEEELRPLFREIAERFPKGEILFDTLPTFLVGREKYHDTIKNMGKSVQFRWGVKNPRSLERWAPGFKLLHDWDYYDYCKKRWGWFGYIRKVPFAGPHFISRIVHLEFAPTWE